MNHLKSSGSSQRSKAILSQFRSYNEKFNWR